MCWSSKISFIFFMIDLIVILSLMKRNAGQDRTYAVFLMPIAGQEICQLILWLHLEINSFDQQGCPLTMKCFSILAEIFADFVPLTMLFMSRKTDRNKQGLKFFSWLFYIIQATLILAAVIKANSWCVAVGPNHHQIWIADAALDLLGGKILQNLSYIIYFLSGIAAAVSLDLPKRELSWILSLGLINFLIIMCLFSQTLEIGSVWCWSAFSFGLYFWFRPLDPSKNEQL